MRQLINYQDIDPKISKPATKKFSVYLLYLAPETVALSIFDDNVPAEVKANNAQVVLEAYKGEEEEEEKNQLKRVYLKLAKKSLDQKIIGQNVVRPKDVDKKTFDEVTCQKARRKTVALACNAGNADVCENLRKVSKLRCFKNFIDKLYIDYDYNSKASMNSNTLRSWMIAIDKKMRLQRRKLLLIMDNALRHDIPDKHTNVEIHFLPPTTMCHLQPLDAGIIHNFKSNYKRHQLDQVITQLDESGTYNITDAIRYVKKSWDSVTLSAISNCWHYTGLTHKPESTDRS
ncbi:tigger transposable element-derived protein 6-like [Octopus sinensis]|uniref:Tigger transposable element-derived protein 6-like n=1 Tax=Octopus sinensis TaxID=2607531 RepID=A0A6P7T0H0_9MOLL|nr:tigger transposable element-derived protein 6-like [Octopus sinensis]